MRLDMRYSFSCPVRLPSSSRQHAQVRGARIFRAVHAMAEARDLDLVGQRVLHALHGLLRIAPACSSMLDHVLIGAAVQRSFQRADGRR